MQNRKDVLQRYYQKNKERFRNDYFKNLEANKASRKKWYEKNRHKVSEQRKIYRKENILKIRISQASFYKKNRDKLLQYQKDYRKNFADKKRNTDIMSRYGITLEQYKTMLLLQKGLCAICKSLMIRPGIDHCHKTKKVRGLLCSNCNLGIGIFKDSVQIMESAIEYIKSY